MNNQPEPEVMSLNEAFATAHLHEGFDELRTGYMPTEAPIGADPKKGAGDLKCPLHLVPTEPVRKMAHVLALGMKKYGIYNWRNSDGVSTSTYTAAIWRHLLEFMDGKDVDEESGESPLAHIMATCAILIDAELVGKLIDDRIIGD